MTMEEIFFSHIFQNEIIFSTFSDNNADICLSYYLGVDGRAADVGVREVREPHEYYRQGRQDLAAGTRGHEWVQKVCLSSSTNFRNKIVNTEYYFTKPRPFCTIILRQYESKFLILN